MTDLEYMENLFNRYKLELSAMALYGGSVNKSKVKRIGIELRQSMLEFERKNFI